MTTPLDLDALEAEALTAGDQWRFVHHAPSPDVVSRLIVELRRLRLIEAAARGVDGLIGFTWTDSAGRDRVAWPVDREGVSEPEDDAVLLALRAALERRT